jgi:hypothetical protein
MGSGTRAESLNEIAVDEEEEENGYFPSNINDNASGTTTGINTPPILRISGLDPSVMMNQTHDPNLLVSNVSSRLARSNSAIAANRAIPAGVAEAPPPFEASPEHHPAHHRHGHASGGGIYRSAFDFSFLESFAADERTRLGLSTGPDRRRPTRQFSTQQKDTAEPSTVIPEEPAIDVVAGGALQPDQSRSPQRRYSQNTAQPRKAGGKLALFESVNANPPPFDLPPTDSPHPMPSNLPSVPQAYSDQPIALTPGHPTAMDDYSHRFAFYSNGLRSTIHARSLSELPAEGQTFEELFLGKKAAAALETSRGFGAANSSSKQAYTSTTTPGDPPAGKKDPADRYPDLAAWKDEEDANSWWMDILSPTGQYNFVSE